MRTALVEMNMEADDVLLPVSSGAPVIDIFCPLFDFRTSQEVAVVRLLVQIDGLVSECHFESAVVVAAEYESGTTVRLYLAVGLERMPTQLRESVHKPHLKRLSLIAQRMDLPVGPDLEIQPHPTLVVMVVRILILSLDLVIIPASFIFIGLRRAE